MSDNKIDWLQDGGLLYALQDGVNNYEVNVTMVAGSRDTADRAAFAERLRAALPPQPEPVAPLETHWAIWLEGRGYVHTEAGITLYGSEGLAARDCISPHYTPKKLYLYAAPPAPASAEPVAFLENGTRYKIAVHELAGTGIYGLPLELAGRWVALVAAEDDQHMRLAAPAVSSAGAVAWLDPDYQRHVLALLRLIVEFRIEDDGDESPLEIVQHPSEERLAAASVQAAAVLRGLRASPAAPAVEDGVGRGDVCPVSAAERERKVWLVEQDDGQPCYLAANCDRETHWHWTRNAGKALHFSRREDAMAALMLADNKGGRLEYATAQEHIFYE